MKGVKMSIRIKDPQPQWWEDREKVIHYKVMNMHTGNALYSGDMVVIYVFKRSKHPKFYVYYRDQIVFGPVSKREDVIDYLMSFNKSERYYFDHLEVIYSENGGYELQNFE